MNEKRREPRKPVNVPVNISLYEVVGVDVNLVQLDAHTKDIAINGLGINIKISSNILWEKLNNFSRHKNNFFIDLEFVTPEKKIVLSGNIARCQITNEESKELRIGISLKEMTKEIRMEWANFVKEF
jgi:hypothetical protein